MSKTSLKILTVVGARPQFVKAAVLSREFAKRGIREIVVHTGQHFDQNMSDIFFEEMEIPRPEYNLAINSLSHGAMTGRMIEEIEKVLLKELPDWVLVYGDTNSTLAGALAAKKLHIRVAHVESGLRSYNMTMPEEVNRILTDRISDLLLCPTDNALKNLHDEGFQKFDCKIEKVGDVMLDAAKFYENKTRPVSRSLPENFALATIHRAENTDDQNRMLGIVDGLNRIHSKLPVVMPVHPRTAAVFQKNRAEPLFETIEPVGYLAMVDLLKRCSLVITDSGGLQKEAYFFRKPCITARTETEWVELVDLGVNVLCSADGDSITGAFHSMINKDLNFDDEVYGTGDSASLITDLLISTKNACR